MEDCIFCKILKGEIPSTKIFESENFIGILDNNPLTDGHTLVIPKKHFETILDMPSTLGQELIKAIKDISLGLIKQKKAEGFNILQSNFKVAQQEIPHLHFHIIPRKENNSKKFKFE